MSSNKTIAKNTIFLYFRMFLTMGVGLYTSRIILKVLGVEDLGIYNLVGGVVVLFSFINNSMSAATQRFVNIAIASNETQNINNVFCTSFNIHFFISLIVLFLAETIGLWFLNNELNIPAARLHSANIVYQMSILTTIVGIIRIPDNAIILAYERMSFFAYFGVFESILKLGIVLSLVYFKSFDYLIIYSVLLFFVSLLGNLIIKIYLINNFKYQTKFHFFYDKNKTKEMLAFTSWNLFGQIANVGANQGLAIIMNLFIGVTVNAAMGIANQLNVAIYSFVSNFQIAFHPQITQSYAKNEIDRHKNLVLNTSKYSFLLMSILAAPFILNTDFIMHLWLGNNLPEYVITFAQIIILSSLVDALAGPFWMSVHAVGNIKKYQIFLSLILILNLPLAYLLLRAGYSPIMVLILKFLLSILAFLYRLNYTRKGLKIETKTIYNYLLKITPILIIFIFIIGIMYLQVLPKTSLLSFILSSLTTEFILILSILLFSLKENEQLMIKLFIKSKINT